MSYIILLHYISSRYLFDFNSFFMSMSHLSMTRYASLNWSGFCGGNIVTNLFKQGWSTFPRIVNSLSSLVPLYSLEKIYSNLLTAKACPFGKYMHSITLPYAPYPIVLSLFHLVSSGIKKSSSSFLKLSPKKPPCCFFF